MATYRSPLYQIGTGLDELAQQREDQPGVGKQPGQGVGRPKRRGLGAAEAGGSLQRGRGAHFDEMSSGPWESGGWDESLGRADIIKISGTNGVKMIFGTFI